MYPIFNLNFGKMTIRSSIFIIFGWNLVYCILVGVKKNVMRESFVFAFLPFYGAPKMQKCLIFAKNGHFLAFWPRKMAKNAKMKDSRITIFLTPTRMLYTKFHPKIMKIEDLIVIFVENQKPKFFGFSSKLGKIWTKNVNLQPKYS